MPLHDVPVDRMVRLPELSAGDVAEAAAHDPALPAPVVVSPPDSRTVASFVAGVIEFLDTLARRLMPGWLPQADGFDGPRGATLAAIRAVAIERARATGQSSTFLADLAERSLTGRPSRTDRPLRPESRVAGLARVLATAFRRERLLLVIPLAGAVSDIVRAGSGWLAHHGRLGVWITGPDRQDVGITGPRRWGSRVTGPGRPPAVPVTMPIGAPHPRSAVETLLEAVLARQAWAHGRIWNGTYQPAPSRNPIRPDLQWPAERVMVELDGPEHCRPEQYDADRVRDVQLQLDGFAVLRFTNARVRHDAQAVAAQIEHLIRARRHDISKGQQGG
ncbi:endonuclease domain-containing protein [Actinoplanes sp. G11-F43]|uniref:endonuclease domain-containing protein n=1 Tax=Actinoplanes sp. G11-F43 TaxID=3424130 RepID=UPI003D337117